jgi:DNA-binding MarR family transcriptional regulator
MPRARTSKTATPQQAPSAAPGQGAVDTSYLRTLVGYNARRAALSIIKVFVERMGVYELKVVEFSVLCLVAHNPGITSRQLCAALDVMPPNLVGLVATLERRGLLERKPHPSDRRAVGLHLTAGGAELTERAQQTAIQLEIDATGRLSTGERQTLIRLLQKVYD